VFHGGDRHGEWAALRERGLLARYTILGGVRLELDASEEAEARRLVEAEQTCCAFLALSVATTDGVVTIDITGARDARPVIDMLTGSAPR
jgi:hypothetical protein